MPSVAIWTKCINRWMSMRICQLVTAKRLASMVVSVLGRAVKLISCIHVPDERVVLWKYAPLNARLERHCTNGELAKIGEYNGTVSMKHPVRRAALVNYVLLLRSGDNAQNKPKLTALVGLSSRKPIINLG